MNIALYSPEDVTILLGGVYQIEGLVEGSFIDISTNSPKWATKITSDGRVSRVYRNDPTHTVKISVYNTADVNNVFSAWTKADGKLFGAMLPLFIKDGLGTTTFYAPLSWVEEIPNVDYENKETIRQWSIRTAGATLNVGGNGQGGVVSTDLAALGMLAADFGGLF